ncbi:hypothetical protein MYD45_003857 [Vibrio parahaemolyticus]|nr:hypothetical protein [Vibrio parahaemolyticus]EJC7041612.1 hypothetical protein [Vibrio parahaemolyticus]ELA8157215.1 hypothetical protein [Vibrio parahaemolyticus]
MDWKECDSINDLKSIDSFINIKLAINAELAGFTKIKARSWCDLYNKICKFKSISAEFSMGNSDFTSPKKRYLFCLTSMSGKARLDALGVTLEHYENIDVATKWKKHIAFLVHPDRASDTRAKEAMQNLEEIYKEMIA